MGTSVLSVSPSLQRTTAGALQLEDVSLADVAREVGTPCYVYSCVTIRRQYERLTQALGDIPHRIHYSVKANSNLAILRLLRELGSGVDIVSGGELFRARQAGYKIGRASCRER